MVSMNKEDKFFALGISLFFIISLYFALSSSLLPDEGTHLLLSVFYRDLVTYIIKTGLSFENAWNYGLEYLLHYPKLQIVYPPLYHLIVALFFNITLNELIGRSISIIFYLLSGILVYLITKENFSRKGAILSALAFLSYFYVFFNSFLALQDMCVYFFVLLSFYLFLKFSKENNLWRFFVIGIVSALATLSKQMGGIVILIYLAILLLRKESLKKIISMLTGFSIIVFPYLVILSAIGGIEINKYQGFLYAYSQGEPTSYFNPKLWIWYIVKPSIIYPPLLFFLLLFAFYIKRKETMWKELLVFFLSFYLGLTLILNKEVRFSTFFVIPCFIAFGKILKNKEKHALGLVSLFFLITIFTSASHLSDFPDEEITALFQREGNIAYFGEGGNNKLPFSSVIMWESRSTEKGEIATQRYHFRGCNFVNISNREEIIFSLKEMGVKYIVYYPNSPVNISLIASEVKLLKEFGKGNNTIKVYEFLGYKKGDNFCNKICLTGWRVCKNDTTLFLEK